MTVLDANLLLYAYNEATKEHHRARTWVEQLFSSGTLIGLPWHTIAAFLRISTNHRLPGNRATPAEAAKIVDTWLRRSNVRLIVPGENYWTLLRQTIIEGQVRGPMITDAELAALSIQCGGVLHTTDRDFARFPGLRWTNPMA